VTHIVIVAGGTGGHVFPALAVAEAMRAQGATISWLGTRQGIEARVVPAAGYELDPVSITGLRGKGLAGWLAAPLRIARALAQSIRVLRARRPGAVLAMGGFVSGPGGVAARLLGTPLVIHEQNAIAGLTNRLLSRIASQVLCGFPKTFNAHPGARHVGNPVRGPIRQSSSPRARLTGHSGKLRVMVVGGSLGAQVFNEVVPRALALIAPAERPAVRHQSGLKHFDAARAAYQSAGVADDAEIVAFIDDMAAAYAWADIVVCRAGAMTIAELAAAGVASVLVPFPHAVDDHQTANAQFLAARNAAMLIPQPDFTAQRLADVLREFNANRPVLIDMAEAARTSAMPDAADEVARLTLGLALEHAHA
jgi:UDP-N-acetylglucosamine--N-acetylmuramyl-(pentapeptide) pyrophosphoryl-undecaprenol N-acetylglucosamine transferase